MKTKYNCIREFDKIILKDNLIKILRLFFYEFTFVKDDVLKENINLIPLIKGSENLNELDYNLIYFQIPIKQKNNVSLIELNNKLIKCGFILEEKAVFRTNYNPIKTTYSKLREFEIQILFNFKRGAKNKHKIIDTQLNLF